MALLTKLSEDYLLRDSTLENLTKAILVRTDAPFHFFSPHNLERNTGEYTAAILCNLVFLDEKERERDTSRGSES